MLTSVEFDKQAVGYCHEVFVSWQLVGLQGRPAQQFRDELLAIRFWQRIELVQQLPGGLRHEMRLAPS